MSKILGRCFLGVIVAVFLMTSSGYAGDNARGRSAHRKPLKIKVVPWGPTQIEIDAAIARAGRSDAVQSILRGTRFRMLEFIFVENEDKRGPTQKPTDFRAVYYDYTNDRTVVAEGDLAGTRPIRAWEEYYNPVPNDDEFNEAVSILKADIRFALAMGQQSLIPFRPMPPTTILDGTVERLVNIGLRTANTTTTEVISVSIKRGEVIRYAENAPPASKAGEGSCGPSSAGQSTTSEGTAGQSLLTVSDGTGTIWEMLVIRPSASSGTRKSGIEVRDVKYRNKSVLKRGHVPVLNVQYTPATCGPYRDWQWQENMLATPTTGITDPAPGIRIIDSPQVATTILETGVDFGNFRGVAIYQQDVGLGPEVVLVTELQAGWYRYINEWRFGANGIIRPRYGFGATLNSCVCDVHNHHAYWRFDFDIVQPNNKAFQVERGRRFLQPLLTEFTRTRNIATNRRLLIQNSAGNEAYMLVPGMLDGVADTFGVSDFWLLRYKNVPGGTNVQNEIDDGETCVNCTDATGAIRISPFITGESIVDQDIVVWYGVHFRHHDGENLLDPNRSPTVISGSHVVGPDLRPVRW